MRHNGNIFQTLKNQLILYETLNLSYSLVYRIVGLQDGSTINQNLQIWSILMRYFWVIWSLSKSDVTNSMKPSIFVRYNREIVITVHLGKINSTNLIRYSSEFVITVIVKTEFHCKFSYFLILNATIFYQIFFFSLLSSKCRKSSYLVLYTLFITGSQLWCRDTFVSQAPSGVTPGECDSKP